MTKREVLFLWAGLVVGFVLGALVVFAVFVPRAHAVHSWAGGRARVGVISPYYFGRY
jgi:hypothetical protein